MLQEKAMLIKHTISKKTFRKFDKKVTAEVAKNHGSDPEKSGRYNKVLIAREYLSEINSVANSAYEHHIQNSLPWEDKGYRILPAAHYLAYMKQQREYKAKFDEAVKKFVADYQTFVDEAKIRLNGMFVESDYPVAEDIADHYDISVAVSPLPSADDFRVNLSKREQTKIRKEVEERIQQVVNDAIKSLWDQLYDSIDHLNAQLVGYKNKEVKRYFRTWINNVKKLLDIIPQMNFTDDQALNDMCKLAKKELCKFSADELMHNDSARDEIERASEAVLEQMNSYMGG